MQTVPMPVGGPSIPTRFPASVSAVYLTGTPTVGRDPEPAGTRPVITDDQCAAVAFSAAALSYLLRRGNRPVTSRVVVAGAARLPVLAPLLWSCGITDVTLWNASDEHGFPLARTARHSDAVLAVEPGAPVRELIPDHPPGAVITLGQEERRAAAPGLLLAAAECAQPHDFGIDALAAAALGLMLTGPPRPGTADRERARTVADTISWVLATRTLPPHERPTSHDRGATRREQTQEGTR